MSGDLIVRPAQPADREAVRRVVAAAFGEQGGTVSTLVDALAASEERFS